MNVSGEFTVNAPRDVVFKTLRDPSSYARFVAIRPRWVRSKNPNCSRYGSYTSMIVSDSSLMDAAIVSRPTGPPLNFSMIVFNTLRSISSSPNSSTSNSASAW